MRCFDSLEKLPCSSLLLRIEHASSSALTPPPYSSGCYNNSMMRMRHSEMELFPLRAQRKTHSVLQRVRDYKDKLGLSDE